VAETLLFNALREAIDEEMARDPHVCVMGEDVGEYGGSYKVTKDLHAKYGELRVLDTPIAENSFTGMAVGAAMKHHLIPIGIGAAPRINLLSGPLREMTPRLPGRRKSHRKRLRTLGNRENSFPRSWLNGARISELSVIAYGHRRCKSDAVKRLGVGNPTTGKKRRRGGY
jgi:hypothetical protein